MNAVENEFSKQFSLLSDEEIVTRATNGSLIESAQMAAVAELTSRGISLTTVPEEVQQNIREKEALNAVHPWRRFWARVFDLYWMLTLAILISLPLSAVGVPPLVLAPFVFWSWVFVEAALLSFVGTTPGKWFLSIAVKLSNGKRPTFLQALQRSTTVLVRGVIFGVPGLFVVGSLFAYRRLTYSGSTYWDEHGGFTVSNGKLIPVRVFLGLAAAYAISYVYSIR